MRRIVLFLVCLLVWATPVFAQNALDPPLTGQMYKLKVFQQPIKVPEVMISSRPTGLKYLSDYKGAIIVLNIWATWCPPCVEEMPSLNELQRAYNKKDVVVIPISLEKEMDVVKKFMNDNKIDQLIPFIDANDDLQKLEALKDAAGVPVTLILNQKMQAIAFYQGDADWNSQEARTVIDYFVANAAAEKKSPPSVNFRSLYY
jgi:thiol-disulfide isomerase/thioredoxin